MALASLGHLRVTVKRAALAEVSTRSTKRACTRRANRTYSQRESPRISQRAGAGIGGGARGELAVELREQGDTVGEAIFGAGGDERGVLRGHSAVDDEARAGKRL